MERVDARPDEVVPSELGAQYGRDELTDTQGEPRLDRGRRPPFAVPNRVSLIVACTQAFEQGRIPHEDESSIAGAQNLVVIERAPRTHTECTRPLSRYGHTERLRNIFQEWYAASG